MHEASNLNVSQASTGTIGISNFPRRSAYHCTIFLSKCQPTQRLLFVSIWTQLPIFTLSVVNGDCKTHRFCFVAFFLSTQIQNVTQFGWKTIEMCENKAADEKLPAAACRSSLWRRHSSPGSRWPAATLRRRSAGSPRSARERAQPARFQSSPGTPGWSRCPLSPRCRRPGRPHLPTEGERWGGGGGGDGLLEVDGIEIRIYEGTVILLVSYRSRNLWKRNIKNWCILNK